MPTTTASSRNSATAIPLFGKLDQALTHASTISPQETLPTADRLDVSEHATLRVSVKSLKDLRTQIRAGEIEWGDHPALGAWLRQHAHLFEPEVEEQARADSGIIKVVEGDLVTGYASRERVGWVAAAHDRHSDRFVILNIVVDTAIGHDLPSQERTGGLNAWSLLVTWTWDWARAANTLRFLRDDRMARDLGVFADIHGAVRARAGGVYTWGSEILDPANDSCDFRAVIGAATSANDAKRTKVKLVAGAVSTMRAGSWSLNPKHLPLGLAPATAVNARTGLDEEVEGAPTIDPAGAAAAERMFKHLAAGWSSRDIAVDEALRGARNEDGVLRLIGLAALLTPKQRGAARRLAQGLTRESERDAVLAAIDRRDQQEAADGDVTDGLRASAVQVTKEMMTRVFQHLRFYETGRHTQLLRASIPARADYHGNRPTLLFNDHREIPERGIAPGQAMTFDEYRAKHTNTFTVGGRNGDAVELIDHPFFYRLTPRAQQQHGEWGFFEHTYSDWPAPFTLTADEWRHVHRNCNPRWLTARTGAPGPRVQSGPTAPLAQLRWSQDDRQLRLRLDHDAYVVLAAPADRSFTAEARPLAKVSARGLHRSLGRLLRELGTTLTVAPLPILRHRVGAEPAAATPVERAQQHLETLHAERGRRKARRKGLREELADIRGADDPDQEEADEARQSIGEATASIRQLDEEIGAATDALKEARSVPPTRPVGNEEASDLAAQLTAVDTNKLLVVGTALEELGRSEERVAPPELANAVAWLLDDGAGLALTRQDGRKMRLGVTLTVPGDDGLPRQVDGGHVLVTDTTGGIRGKQRSPDLPTLREEAAREVLRDHNYEQFIERTGWSYTFLVEAIRDWLHAGGIAGGAATALLDAARTGNHHWPAPPIVYAYLTCNGNITAKAEAAEEAARKRDAIQLIDPILAAYITSSHGWPTRGTGLVRTPLASLRQGIAFVAAQPGARVNRTAFAQRFHIDRSTVAGLFRDPNLDGVAGAALTPTEITIPRCGRTDGSCPSPTTLMTHVVAVPELMLLDAGPLAHHGRILVCTSCRRPSGDYWTDRPLPDVYLDHWDTPAKRVSAHNPEHRTFIADPPSASWPILAPPRLSLQAAARRLNIAYATARKLVDDGVLPAAAVHNYRGGYTVDPADIDRDHVRRAASELRRASLPEPDEA